MELMYWVAICVTAGLLGAGVRRKELDEALLGGLIISILLLFVAIQKGFIGMDASAIPIAITASLMFGYASYGVYEQNKEELHGGAMMGPYAERDYGLQDDTEE